MNKEKIELETPSKDKIDQLVEDAEKQLDIIGDVSKIWPQEVLDSLYEEHLETGIPLDEIYRMQNLAYGMADPDQRLGKPIAQEEEDQIRKEYNEYLQAKFDGLPRIEKRRIKRQYSYRKLLKHRLKK